MLCLFGINLKKQTKTFKIHTQDRKVATYTSTNLKVGVFFFFILFSNNGTWNDLHTAFGERNEKQKWQKRPTRMAISKRG